MKIWHNGKFVKPAQIAITPFAYSMQRAVAVQDSLCAFKTSQGPAIFRLAAHVRRFFDSAKLINMKLGFSEKDMTDQLKKAVKKSGLPSCYIRPIAYYGHPTTGILPANNKVDLAIGLFPFHSKPKSLRIKISSLKKVSSKCIPTQAKVSAHYLASALAKEEALKAGFDEGLFFDNNGYVAEAPTANIFIVKDGEIITPKLDNILAGITRDSVIVIAKDMGFKVSEKNIYLQHLLNADEIFYTSSAINVMPVVALEQHKFKVGPITKTLQVKFNKIIAGQDEAYHKWLEFC